MDGPFHGKDIPFHGSAHSFPGSALRVRGTINPFLSPERQFHGPDDPRRGTDCPFSGTGRQSHGTARPMHRPARPMYRPDHPMYGPARPSSWDRRRCPARRRRDRKNGPQGLKSGMLTTEDTETVERGGEDHRAEVGRGGRANERGWCVRDAPYATPRVMRSNGWPHSGHLASDSPVRLYPQRRQWPRGNFGTKRQTSSVGKATARK